MKHSDGSYYDIFGNKVTLKASSSKLTLQILVNNSSIEVCQNIYTVAREYQNNLEMITTNRPNYVYAHGPAETGSSYCKTNKKFFTDGANDYIGCVTNLDTLTIMKLCTDKNKLNSTWEFDAYYVM